MNLIDAKTFNEMLRKDKLLFPTIEAPVLGNWRVCFRGEILKSGIEYALTHFDEIAELECKNIFNRRKGNVIAHLKAAKSFIAMYQPGDETEKLEKDEENEEERKKMQDKLEEKMKAYAKIQKKRLKLYEIDVEVERLKEKMDILPDFDSEEQKRNFPYRSSSLTIRLHWFDRISEFLIKCHLLARTNPSEFTILVDRSREEQVYKMFGTDHCWRVAEPDENDLPQYEFQPINFDKNSFCTQIIFDSADLQSAMDTMFASLRYTLDSPWDINVIFIQESLRDEVMQRMNINRMDDNDGKLMFEEVDEEVKTKYGGRVFRNQDSDVEILLDVPPKYIDMKNEDTVCINFFRTAKEVNAMIKECPCKLFSIWTEKIGLFYEMAAKLNGSIIWSNSVGLIDENTARTLYGFSDESQSGQSMINNDERYAVHRLRNDNGTSKYLVIPFGVTFAN